MKDIIKKAVDLAENEIQEKQIENFKNIIKNLLQKKTDLEKEKDDLEKDIKIIKQDIDDFKAGRLDKIKERHDIDERAEKVAPVHITIINQNNHPTQPWRWNYDVVWSPYYNNTLTAGGWTSTTTGTAILTSSSNTAYLGTCGTNMTGAGNAFATFTSGTYELPSGDIINL